ncbi:IucA/IucC family protein [Streptomyces sp. H10-C2]|uniref:IucA/IucC family protein n=1 Tax=unclassified Streptomyces TaxID=2593676 RepID=UPI0024BA8901|nr:MULTISPECIES: IucA/IucC family protein [unclassified Streptomyces]MDJ0344634.1 IucA/IucC family protein [Streptomyces sp. PH10-H1]MDJ0373206.1 IucA/IucC family protein [Streptomyces sp. H10-C2]
MLRVLSALLREDVVGLRTRSTLVEEPDGRWLRLPYAYGDGSHQDALLLPVTEDGFQSEYAARLPLLRRASDGRELTGTDTVLRALRALADPADQAGFDAFAEECRQTTATLRLHARVREEAIGRLAKRYGPDTADWTYARSLGFDALAAFHDHPVYPTSRGRSGLSETELHAYAPEFHQEVAPRWLVLPREAVTESCGGPGEVYSLLWPTPASLGMPELRDSHTVLPVHPLTVGRPLAEALRATGLEGRAFLADRPHLALLPTLSMRTLADRAHPLLHLKLPLATATLGLRNRRTIKPGTLADGAACQLLLRQVIAREPRFQESVLLADERRYAHAGHELLAVMLRRYPEDLQNSVLVPMAALLAQAPGGRLVIDQLADRFYDSDPVALLDGLLALLFDWQTTLFGYGIALESHQQNISLALDRDRRTGTTRLRLVLKDNDGPRINTARLRQALGELPSRIDEFDDERIFCASDDPLVDLFTTITVHLCAGSYAFGLAAHGRAPLDQLLRLVRDRLTEAVDRLGGEPADVLRERVLEAERLPVKAMVSAGTLLSKERSGAADINKHYTTGPNYLLDGAGSR